MVLCATSPVSVLTICPRPTLVLAFTCWPQRATTQTELHGCADQDAYCVILQLQWS